MLQSNRKGGPRVGSTRAETRPFVPDTVRISGLSVPVGGTPSQARGTPLPKPAVDLKAKKPKRESSLLGLVVPKLGRKKADRAPAPPARSTTPLFRPDPTLEVSQSDMLLDSSTQELELTDLSSVSDPSQSISLSPAQRYGRSRRHGPWVVWGLVGGAWCVMIALALLAVDDSSKSNARTAGVMRVTQEQSAMAAITAEPAELAEPKLAASAPTAPAVHDEGVKAAAQPTGALNPASIALVDDQPAVEPGDATPSKRERAAVKKRSKKKLKAQYQKRKKHKKSRHHAKRAHKG